MVIGSILVFNYCDYMMSNQPNIHNQTSLAEALGALSLATDMSAGNPPGSALTATVLAVRIGQKLGLSTEDQQALYFACITRFIGCTSTSEETAAMAFGDEFSPYLALSLADPADPKSVRTELNRHALLNTQEELRQTLFEGVIGMGSEVMRLGMPHCSQAISLTRRIPVPDSVPDILSRLESRWDNQHPVHPPGPELLPATRIIEFCVVAELHRRAGGLRSMIEVARARSGGQFEPAVVHVFLEHVADLTQGFSKSAEWQTFLDSEPGEQRTIGDQGMRRVAEAFADFTDNKSRWFVGHSRQVAGLSYSTAVATRSDERWCSEMFTAALLHDIGKCAIANGIWDKEEPLTPYEESIAHQHTMHTEHILSLTQVFHRIGGIACSAHERADGSGYHRRIRLEEPRAAILAVANIYNELTTDGPRHSALKPEMAAEKLLTEAHKGCLPQNAVRAVLDSAGQPRSAMPAYPDGMTNREADVLRHLARGKTNKDIARALNVAPKTVDNHVQNLYRKIGTQTRAAAAMYAFERGIFDT